MIDNLKLSVLDVESKYKVDYAEYSYGNSNNTDRPVGWGEDNQLPNLYYNCYAKSSTLKAIIDSCVNYTLGDDIFVNNQAAYWKEKVNRSGMTIRQFCEKIALSLFIYNGFAVQVVYNKLGQKVELFPLDFRKCRVNETGTKVYFSKTWSKYQGKYDTFDIYDPENLDPEKPTQIFWYKSSTLSNIYPYPMYNGAIYDCISEIESSRYSLSTITGGFAAKHLIQFPENSNLTDEQKSGIEEAIKNKFCGPDANASFMLYWRNGDSDADKIEVSKIESDDNAERYLAIRNSVRENIFISMRTSPMLCGLPINSGFSTNEYRDSLQIFLKNVISPVQDIIRESFDKITGTKDGISIVPYAINFDE
jgi:hypothetical protein